MLKASGTLISYIKGHRNKELLASKWGVSLFTVYKILKRSGDISGSTVGRIINTTGFSFESAFDTSEC